MRCVFVDLNGELVEFEFVGDPYDHPVASVVNFMGWVKLNEFYYGYEYLGTL